MPLVHTKPQIPLGHSLSVRLMGTETEYGIYVDGVEPGGLDQESARLVESVPPPFASPWDYSAESPRCDLRGFTVRALARDARDAAYDATAPVPAGATPADRVLPNGARFYNDHAHPEYSTPECASLWDLVAHEKAGEQIVAACASRRAADLGRTVTLYKNNTDFHGMSYGAHENYLVPRAVPHEALLAGLLPFLVSRQAFAGAGKAGVERHRAPKVRYQLSQRADFFDTDVGVDTLARRPIVNTRDEPHTDASHYRRLHVICGDANLSEYAIALKIGTTALVLETLVSGSAPAIRLTKPVEAVRRISWDPTLQYRAETADGRQLTALEIQRAYLEAASALELPAGSEGGWVLRQWGGTLDALAHDPESLVDRIDWVAKHSMLESYAAGEAGAWDPDAMQSLDLAYHDLDTQAGLFRGLEQQNTVQRLVTLGDVARAVSAPPGDTRAALRGLCVRRFAPQIEAIRWGRVVLSVNGDSWAFDIDDLVDGLPPGLLEALASVGTLEELSTLVARREGA